MGDGQDKLAQPELVPVEALFCGPVNTGTVDASDGCFCPNGAAYIIKKSKADNPRSPHNEWFCANLALKSGVPIAPFNIVKHTDQKEWFGSQYRVGEIRDWWFRVLDGAINIADICDDLSKVYAFDLFVNNTDRHLRNFLVIPQDGSHRALAMDHGRSWLFNDFPPSNPPLPWCSTMKAFFWMKDNFTDYPSKEPMIEILTSISKIGYNEIEDILQRQPDIWLEANAKDDIVSWWKNGSAVDRATSIIKGVADDSLL